MNVRVIVIIENKMNFVSDSMFNALAAADKQAISSSAVMSLEGGGRSGRLGSDDDFMFPSD